VRAKGKGSGGHCEEAGCDGCGSDGVRVEERGRAVPLAPLRDTCWNTCASAIAIAEGANAPPPPVFGPDQDRGTWAPPGCRYCGSPVLVLPTNYDRWVALEFTDVPAKSVPAHYHWTVRAVRAHGSGLVIDRVAFRRYGIPTSPNDLIRPAHRAPCPASDAVDEVAAERLRERERSHGGQAAMG
jgi:hypothetical protein